MEKGKVLCAIFVGDRIPIIKIMRGRFAESHFHRIVRIRDGDGLPFCDRAPGFTGFNLYGVRIGKIVIGLQIATYIVKLTKLLK